MKKVLLIVVGIIFLSGYGSVSAKKLDNIINAAYHGNFSLMEKILDSGVDVNFIDSKGNSALFAASLSGKKNMVRLLLNNGADTNLKNKNKNKKTPIITASMKGHTDIVKILLEYGTDPNVVGLNKITALQSAVAMNHKDIVKLLLKHGVNTELKSKDGLTALHIAIIKKYISIAKLLIENKANVHAKDDKGILALHMAAGISGGHRIVTLLIEKGANIDAKSLRGVTALALSVHKDNPKSTMVLINKGADLYVEDDRGLTVLHDIVVKEKIELVELLIRKGVSFNIGTRNQNITPLMLAVHSKNLKITKILLESGVEIDAQNEVGFTALHSAVDYGNQEITELLLQYGANPSVLSQEGISPIAYAKVGQNPDYEIAELLSEYAKEINSNRRFVYKTKKLNQVPTVNKTAIYGELSNLLSEQFEVEKDLNKYLFAVSIGDYDEAPDVSFANNSGDMFVKALKQLGVPEENTMVLSNSKATGTRIISRLKRILNRLDENSELYFYYVGHGLPSKDNNNTYILPVDGDIGSYEDSRLSMNSLYKLMSDSKAKHINVFIDACFSGRVDQDTMVFKGVAGLLIKPRPKIDINRMTVFTAGEGNQFANEYEEKGHRLFSYHLIKGLLEGKTNLRKLAAYVQKNVSKDSRKLGPTYTQEPVIYGSLNHDF